MAAHNDIGARIDHCSRLCHDKLRGLRRRIHTAVHVDNLDIGFERLELLYSFLNKSLEFLTAFDLVERHNAHLQTPRALVDYRRVSIGVFDALSFDSGNRIFISLFSVVYCMAVGKADALNRTLFQYLRVLRIGFEFELFCSRGAPVGKGVSKIHKREIILAKKFLNVAERIGVVLFDYVDKAVLDGSPFVKLP